METPSAEGTTFDGLGPSLSDDEFKTLVESFIDRTCDWKVTVAG